MFLEKESTISNFSELVKKLVLEFGIDYFVIGVKPENTNGFNGLLLAIENQSFTPLSYQWENTPWKIIFENSTNLYPADVELIFPNDNFLKYLEVKSFVGTPFKFDNCEGVIVSMFKSNISNDFGNQILKKLLLLLNEIEPYFNQHYPTLLESRMYQTY